MYQKRWTNMCWCIEQWTSTSQQLIMQKTPETVSFYNETKYGVDILDQMAIKYTRRTGIQKWPISRVSKILWIRLLLMPWFSKKRLLIGSFFSKILSAHWQSSRLIYQSRNKWHSRPSIIYHQQWKRRPGKNSVRSRGSFLLAFALNIKNFYVKFVLHQLNVSARSAQNSQVEFNWHFQL